jgi:hypothetical protein
MDPRPEESDRAGAAGHLRLRGAGKLPAEAIFGR